MGRKVLLSFSVFLIVFVAFMGFGKSNYAYSLTQSGIGDVNVDNSIDSTDFTLLKRYVLRIIRDFPAEDSLWVGDLDGDNDINSSDIHCMKRYLLRMIDRFPKELMNNTPIPTATPTQKPTYTPTATPTPTQRPTFTPIPTQSNNYDDGYFPAGTSKSELISRASALSVGEIKSIIKKHVDDHWDVIRSVCGFKNKEVAYAFFFGMATRESTFRAGTETGSGAAHAFGPLQTAETAYANADPNYMPEENVPEMTQYDFNDYNFYDVGVSTHMGIRHFLHFARLAQEKYSGKDVLRHGLMGYNTGWIDGSDEAWIIKYADETAALGAWYYKNNHMSDDEFTWDTDPRVDRSDPWSFYF